MIPAFWDVKLIQERGPTRKRRLIRRLYRVRVLVGEDANGDVAMWIWGHDVDGVDIVLRPWAGPMGGSTFEFELEADGFHVATVEYDTVILSP